MNFKPEISTVAIYNEALAILPSSPVTAPTENSLAARECRRFYKSVVANLLERYHWNHATKRVTLAAVTNDREDEWGYAYAVPSDMAFPVRAFGPEGAYAGWMLDGGAYLLGGRKVFLQQRGTLYSTINASLLEYTSYDIEEAEFSTIFKDIVVLELASRICIPITKDDKRAQDLATRAEVERSRAIAIDLNRNQPTYGNRPTETELVRGAGWSSTATGNWPLDPVRNPSLS